MKKITVIGAGKIGATMARFLHSGGYGVTVIDRDAQYLAKLDLPADIARREADIAQGLEASALEGQFAVLSAAPFHLTRNVAKAAAEAGVHYLDLTEDVASTRDVRALAENASSAFIPQCGLAPGFVSIAAHDLASHFDTLDTIRLRVGALPRFPSNALGYNLTWSTDGLINEYIEPCEAIIGGKRAMVPAMEGYETLGVDGVAYEAFNTSGGLGSLCETYDGKVRELNYRTMRYPGHRDIMKILLSDLRLAERRHILHDIFTHAIPGTSQDVVVVFITVTGTKNGQLRQETLARTIQARHFMGVDCTAIQITTAGSICAVLDLLAEGKIPTKGFVRQEDIPLDLFLENRFGNVYNHGAH
ncbi:saccharopine dehydrogenase family protein [Gluconobacter wancherniae]|uniref:Saccharopine dehydrogenase n=1 Tax=Gluconobacter wancherniae NBRC 103581 TaxID=656744 RepID=A0A511B3T6_9PROT|nr:saccharopine dehydrogenase C-terminal domain-containing protein [Gluconobacter wancherniae]MBF0854564.1 NAD-binding protein [Gluconobacter wancherniae]MBS1062912.1 saccharopine dehydrogenase NADP-binding domain-containing protein [Gluconobacter wancherniae]MBS1089669.1 saccharopine dehydrogenase NADP-binding domain-containing protein [Gluconobacter wancherniae]MBS1095751.1 saccharopine dehydrogenase NADP-binding domain-containing protein [Gluconobacter wancherniae]GBD57710.1 saccharopine de